MRTNKEVEFGKTILVTGANGFIGKNLCIQLRDRCDYNVITVTRNSSTSDLIEAITNCDAIVHLAGENRPSDTKDYFKNNTELTSTICNEIKNIHDRDGKVIPIIFASSTKVCENSEYGNSKLLAEKKLTELQKSIGSHVRIYRLPNVFGKWCKPNYNSVVSTFCNNLINNKPLIVHDENKKINLLYIDDLLDQIVHDLKLANFTKMILDVKPNYGTTLIELKVMLESIHNMRFQIEIPSANSGLMRALYATYVSYLPPTEISYELIAHRDKRGFFAELFKNKEIGQISVITAYPGETRGGHYHHTKIEKFILIKGSAEFNFKNIITNEHCTIKANSQNLKVVETPPGWLHEIINTGNEEIIVILWCNEIFNNQKPDTYIST